MKDWQEILKELAKKLPPSLAFPALMVFVGVFLREQLPPQWRVVPFLLAVLGVVVNVLIEIVQARRKANLPKWAKPKYKAVPKKASSSRATKTR